MSEVRRWGYGTIRGVEQSLILTSPPRVSPKVGLVLSGFDAAELQRLKDEGFELYVRSKR